MRGATCTGDARDIGTACVAIATKVNSAALSEGFQRRQQVLALIVREPRRVRYPPVRATEEVTDGRNDS